jgi:hypothetical protein
LDVVKTRLMTQGANRTYSGVLDAFGKIWREEGAAAFLSVSASARLASSDICSRSAPCSPSFCRGWSVPAAGDFRLLADFACCATVSLLSGQGWQPRVIWIGIGGCVFFTGAPQAGQALEIAVVSCRIDSG